MSSAVSASTRELIALARAAAHNRKDAPPPPPMAPEAPRRRPWTLRFAGAGFIGASFVSAGLAGLAAMIA